jgi:Domain of Unknown Function (DUF928)
MSNRLNYSRVLASALAFLSLVIPIAPSAARYRPPSSLTLPGGRQGAGTRTDCAKADFTFAPVVPTSNYGQTVAAYPSVYWYQANHTFSWVRFELFVVQPQTLKRDSDPIYQTTYRLKQDTPWVSLTLPERAGFSPLKVGQIYQWKVTLLCSAQGPDDETASGSQCSIQGWIERVPSPNLKWPKSPRRHKIYAEKGLWYDAISDLAEDLRQHPQQAHLMQEWQTLLQETTLDAATCGGRTIHSESLKGTLAPIAQPR